MSSIPVYSELEVRDVLTLETVLESLQQVFEREADGTAVDIAKTMTTWQPRSSANALGALDQVAGLVAFKTWVNTPGGASAQLNLFTTDGKLLASMAAGYLGRFRTAAISGLATKFLAAPDADELAIIGTGGQAIGQVEAVNLVRPLRRVRVFSPDADRRAAFAETVRTTLGVEVLDADSVAAAVDGAPIVTLITRASEPFLERGMLARGAHLNAVGAILPTVSEFDPKLLEDSDLTVVDSLENAQQASRELIDHFGDDWSGVHTLGEVLGGTVTRPGDPQLTVFKALGRGLSDLASASAFARLSGLVGEASEG